MTNTPPTLLPIGTKCIMRRLSQAALAHELGFKPIGIVDGTLYPPKKGRPYSFIPMDEDREFVPQCITVTEENQKWLSTPQYYTKPDGSKVPLIEFDEVKLP